MLESPIALPFWQLIRLLLIPANLKFDFKFAGMIPRTIAVDEDRRPGRFVILGSASPTLLRQSSESLAGRINYLEMFPLSLSEVQEQITWQNLWLYGGFPEPASSGKPAFVRTWYRNFTQSYVQRDLPLYGLAADPHVTRQLLHTTDTYPLAKNIKVTNLTRFLSDVRLPK